MSSLYQLFIVLPGQTEEKEFGLPSSETIARGRAKILCHHTAGLTAHVRRIEKKVDKKGNKNG